MDKTVNSIICDNCGAELIVDSALPANYSLELRSINTGINTSSVTFPVHLEPWLKNTVHFCGKECLATWCDEHTG